MIDKTQATKNGIKIIDTTKATNALFDILQTQFPQTIKDGQISLNAIANLLGLQSSNIQGYELTFTGKGLANALYNTPCEKVLTLKDSFPPTNTPPQTPRLRGGVSHISPSLAEGDKGGGFDSTKNAIIIGDNLDALKILKSAYTEKIKMIYIDPPYNTANDNFIYPDNFREDYKAILREVGLIEIDENGEETESENLRFFKNIQSSRTHSGWLSFMLPRLKLARDLLKEDGVIFISIDDNEQANLKILCDEIFGEDNFVASIPRLTSAQRPAQEKYVGINHDYILIYSKDKSYSFHSVINRDFSKEIFCDSIGKFFKNDTSPILASATQGYSSGGDYDVEFNGKIFSPIDSNGNRRRWLWTKERMKKAIELGIVVETKNSLRVRNYIDKEFQVGTNEMVDKDEKLSATSFDLMKSEFVNDKGTDEVKELSIPFSFPKPINLIKILLQLSTSAVSNDIILDFFAGSGTTAQAVMELNAEDNGNRQCILVQLDEKIDSVKSKVAYDFCKNELKSDKPTISDITAERVRRASVKIATKITKENMDLGFKLYSLESKSKLISDEKGALRLMTNANLSANDKALNLALQSGKTLDKPIEIVVENKLYKCEDSYFCVECDEIVLEALSQTSYEYIYIDAYSDINLEHFLNLDARFKERLNVVY